MTFGDSCVVQEVCLRNCIFWNRGICFLENQLFDHSELGREAKSSVVVQYNICVNTLAAGIRITLQGVVIFLLRPSVVVIEGSCALLCIQNYVGFFHVFLLV